MRHDDLGKGRTKWFYTHLAINNRMGGKSLYSSCKRGVYSKSTEDVAYFIDYMFKI